MAYRRFYRIVRGTNCSHHCSIANNYSYNSCSCNKSSHKSCGNCRSSNSSTSSHCNTEHNSSSSNTYNANSNNQHSSRSNISSCSTTDPNNKTISNCPDHITNQNCSNDNTVGSNSIRESSDKSEVNTCNNSTSQFPKEIQPSHTAEINSVTSIADAAEPISSAAGSLSKCESSDTNIKSSDHCSNKINPTQFTVTKRKRKLTEQLPKFNETTQSKRRQTRSCTSPTKVEDTDITPSLQPNATNIRKESCSSIFNPCSSEVYITENISCIDNTLAENKISAISCETGKGGSEIEPQCSSNYITDNPTQSLSDQQTATSALIGNSEIGRPSGALGHGPRDINRDGLDSDQTISTTNFTIENSFSLADTATTDSASGAVGIITTDSVTAVVDGAGSVASPLKSVIASTRPAARSVDSSSTGATDCTQGVDSSFRSVIFASEGAADISDSVADCRSVAETSKSVKESTASANTPRSVSESTGTVYTPRSVEEGTASVNTPRSAAESSESVYTPRSSEEGTASVNTPRSAIDSTPSGVARLNQVHYHCNFCSFAASEVK